MVSGTRGSTTPTIDPQLPNTPDKDTQFAISIVSGILVVIFIIVIFIVYIRHYRRKVEKLTGGQTVDQAITRRKALLAGTSFAGVL